MSFTLKEAIQARKLKLIATELEPLARQDRTVKKIVDTLKKGKEPNPDDITSLKGDTQDDVVMAFASVIGPSKTSDFLGEGKEDPDIGDRKGSQPASYHKGLAASTKEKRDAQFKKQSKMSDDDPNAYKPAPGDKEAKTKPSQYTKKYDKMFGEENITEQNVEKSLRKKSEETGVAYSILKDVYDRGVAAWRTGHRPGTTPTQWGLARVNSFVTGGKTQKTTDADLWKKHKGQNEEVELKENLFKKIKAIRDKKKRMKEIDKELKQLNVDWEKAGPKHEKDWSFIDRRADISKKEKELARELMKLRNEEVDLDEAVRVDDIRFKRSHGKAPKGTGLWGFTTKRYGEPKESETYMPAMAMDYKKAVEMGKKWADRQGSSVVYVLESVSKNTAQGYANRGRSTFKSMHKMVKGLVRADDDMVTNYLDSTHGRHLADAERDLSAIKLKDYIKKDFAMFKKKYDPKLYEANIEDMMPASPDEKRMAMKQAEFVQYVGREIGEHLVANKEFPEWMQNKLSALHQKAKDMHATLGAHGETFEEVELDEAKTIKVSFHSPAAKKKWMKKQSISPKEIISQSSTMVELPASMKQYTQKKDHDEIYQVKESVKQEVSMSNYNYRTEAHTPLHVSKAIRIAESMSDDAVEKIEALGEGLSKHPKVREALGLFEKAESEAQAIAARIALKHKREGTKPEPGTASAEMMKMSEKDLEDFTKVKKGAPEKVQEAVKFTHLVVDKDGKVKGAHTSEKDAKSMAFRIKGEVEKLKKPLSRKQVDNMMAMNEAKMSDAEVLSAAKKLAANGKDEKAKKFGQGLVDFYKKNDGFTPDQVAGLQNIMKNASFQMAKEELDLMESHFKVGDKVTCIESGMKGEVIKLDEPQVGKYYTVRRDDGKVMKYASDELKKVMKEAMDPVDKEALKKKFKKRKDKDIDNDGDVDDSDEYLHNRRKTIAKAVAKEQSETKLKEKDVDKDGDADDLDKSLEKRKQKVLDTD